MGGLGKSQAALEYCRPSFRNGRFDTVLWIDATSLITVQQAIESIVSKAKVFAASCPPQSFKEKLSAFKDTMLSLSKPWLLIFDNYDSPKDFPSLGDVIPQSEHAFVIITSRHGGSLRLGSPVGIAEMGPEEAENLLLASSGLARPETQPEVLRSIVGRLGYLPLALDQAGAYIGTRNLLLENFEQHYTERREKILRHTPELFKYRKTLSQDSQESVLSAFTTWELSFE